MKGRTLTVALLGLLVMTSGTVGCANGGLKSQTLTKHAIDDKYRNYYEIFVYSFCDSNGDGIGDLKGITSKLDYIQDMGFTGLWLTPIFSSPSYHKYNASNYFEVDSQFGTMADLEELISECHKRDINIILDLVLNHCSRSNEYFTRAVQAHDYKLQGITLTDQYKGYEDLFSFYDTVEEANAARITYYQVPGKTFYYEGNFDSDMPEFNFDSDKAWELFDDIMEFYLKKGVDGFRLDAVKYYYMTNMNKSIEALNKVKAIANKYKEDNYIVGECWDATGIIESFYSSDIDSYFWFPGSVSSSSGFIKSSTSVGGQFKYEYLSGYKAMEGAIKGKIAAPFLDNHDTSRAAIGNTSLTKFYYGLLSMLTGCTFSYYGDELGISASVVGTDANVRTHMDWSKNDEGETRDPNSGTAEYRFGSVAEQQKDRNSILNYYKAANNLRNCLPQLQRGTLGETYEDSEGTIVAFDKTYNNETITVVINFSDSEIAPYETTKTYVTSLLVNSKDKITQKGNSFNIPSLGIAIFK